jgi:hypothetical protein
MTTKPNMGKLVLTNVLFAQLGLVPIMVSVLCSCAGAEGSTLLKRVEAGDL